MAKLASTIIQGDFDEPDIKLFSSRYYWATRDNTFKIRKNETAAVYIVRR